MLPPMPPRLRLHWAWRLLRGEFHQVLHQTWPGGEKVVFESRDSVVQRNLSE